MGAKKGKGGAARSPAAPRPVARGAAPVAPEPHDDGSPEGGAAAGGAPLRVRVAGGLARVAVKALPNAPRSAFAGLRGGELAVRVAAAPDKGKANEELVRFVAGALGLSRNQVTLETGATSRHKLIAIPEAALDRLRAMLSDSPDGAGASG